MKRSKESLIKELEKFSGVAPWVVEVDGIKYYVNPFMTLKLKDDDDMPVNIGVVMGARI